MAADGDGGALGRLEMDRNPSDEKKLEALFQADREAFKRQLSEQQDVWNRTNPEFVEYIASSRDYGVSGLKSVIILNGGALLAFPVYIATLKTEGHDLPVSLIAFAAILFVIGVMLGACSHFGAYLNYNWAAVSLAQTRNKKLLEIEADHDLLTSNTLLPRRKTEYDFYNEQISRYDKLVRISRYITLSLAIAAYLSFFVGSIFALLAMLDVAPGQNLMSSQPHAIAPPVEIE